MHCFAGMLAGPARSCALEALGGRTGGRHLRRAAGRPDCGCVFCWQQLERFGWRVFRVGRVGRALVVVEGGK